MSAENLRKCEVYPKPQQEIIQLGQITRVIQQFTKPDKVVMTNLGILDFTIIPTLKQNFQKLTRFKLVGLGITTYFSFKSDLWILICSIN